MSIGKRGEVLKGERELKEEMRYRKPRRKPSVKRERLIKRYVAEGYSANKIQKELHKQGLGIRRKILLAKIRRIKGVPKRKFRRERVYVAAKWIAVYGTVDGKSRRVELAGSGRQLFRAMLDLAVHPPKKRFVRCAASDVPYVLDHGDE
jgi:hypothetical protein